MGGLSFVLVAEKLATSTSQIFCPLQMTDRDIYWMKFKADFTLYLLGQGTRSLNKLAL